MKHSGDSTDCTLQPAVDLSVLERLERHLGSPPPGPQHPTLRFISIFFGSAEEILPQLAAALTRGDLEAAARGAHKFKSGALNMGTGPLARLCQQLDQQARAGRAEGLSALLQQVQAEYQRARQVLEQVRRQRAGG